MANSSIVYVRLDPQLKHEAEGILSRLGITPSSAVQMLYSQIVLHKGMPFDLTLPETESAAMINLTREQLDLEILKGIESLRDGNVLSSEEVDDLLAKEFNI
ncbi:MAG: type II toxin-antitoxin system RelB/DinJ family antitoxin [Clostridiales bacterium]|nr:type II toxin-antitoxin system RelB/DinJ family antitoxin [Clostridiales bacterium]